MPADLLHTLSIPEAQRDAVNDSNSYFGSSQCFARNGTQLVVGCPKKYWSTPGTKTGVVYIFDPSDGSLLDTLYPRNADGDDVFNARFGWSVASNGDWLVVSVLGRDAVYFYKWNGSSWVFNARRSGSTTVSGDSFGCQVSISGSVAAIGAMHDDDAASDAGCVFIWRESGGAWPATEDQIIQAPVAQANMHFGAALSLDGTVLGVGAPDYDGTYTDEGQAYVYEDTGSFSKTGDLDPGGSFSGDKQFGSSIRVSGTTVAVGWHSYDNNASPYNRGQVQVFEKTGPSTWPVLDTIDCPDPYADMLDTAWLGRGIDFGSTFCIGTPALAFVDRDTLLAGAPQWERSPGSGGRRGAAFVFRRSGSTYNFAGADDLYYPDVEGDFGGTIAVDSAVGYYAISSYEEDTPDGTTIYSAGVVRVYDSSVVTCHALANTSFEDPGTDPGDADQWSEDYDEPAEDVAGFTDSSSYPRPVENFEDSWDSNENAQTLFGLSDLAWALFEDGASQVESFEYSWREPSTGDPVAWNHQSSFTFDESNFAWAAFDTTPEDVEDFEEDWGVSPYNQAAIDDYSEGTFVAASFDVTPEAYEDFEEDWGISPYNQSAIDDYSEGTFSAAQFDVTPEAYEDFEEDWTETFVL